MSKPVHAKTDVEEFQPGMSYAIKMDNQPLYTAKVVKFHGGCWATVVVTEPAANEAGTMYQPGMEFDIKVAEYQFEQVETQDEK